MKDDRRYHGASSSPAPKRTAKGKSAPVSDGHDHIEKDRGYRIDGDEAGDEIIEENFEDEEGDEDEEK